MSWKIKHVKAAGSYVATRVTELKGKVHQEQIWNTDKEQLKKVLEELCGSQENN